MNFVDGRIIESQGLRFKSNNNDLEFDIEAKRQQLMGYIDKQITLGLRAKDIHEFHSWGKAKKPLFDPKIEVVEPVGNEIFIYFDIDGKQIVGRLPSDIKVTMGEKLSLALDIEKLHFFDTKTEKSIT